PVQDTYNYLMLVLRTVMYFNPIKILFPVGMLLLLVGVLRQIWWFVVGNMVVHASNVLLVLAGLNFIMMALLAVVVVRRARQGEGWREGARKMLYVGKGRWLRCRLFSFPSSLSITTARRFWNAA